MSTKLFTCPCADQALRSGESPTHNTDTPNSGHLLYSGQCAMYIRSASSLYTILKKPPIIGHLLTLNSAHFVLLRHYQFNRKPPPNSGRYNSAPPHMRAPLPKITFCARKCAATKLSTILIRWFTVLCGSSSGSLGNL